MTANDLKLKYIKKKDWIADPMSSDIRNKIQQYFTEQIKSIFGVTYDFYGRRNGSYEGYNHYHAIIRKLDMQIHNWISKGYRRRITEPDDKNYGSYRPGKAQAHAEEAELINKDIEELYNILILEKLSR